LFEPCPADSIGSAPIVAPAPRQSWQTRSDHRRTMSVFVSAFRAVKSCLKLLGAMSVDVSPPILAHVGPTAMQRLSARLRRIRQAARHASKSLPDAAADGSGSLLPWETCKRGVLHVGGLVRALLEAIASVDAEKARAIVSRASSVAARTTTRSNEALLLLHERKAHIDDSEGGRPSARDRPRRGTMTRRQRGNTASGTFHVAPFASQGQAGQGTAREGST